MFLRNQGFVLVAQVWIVDGAGVEKGLEAAKQRGVDGVTKKDCRHGSLFLVAPGGLEPTTHGL